jgi:glycosyltransferase involved in cell wall biosynthesis
LENKQTHIVFLTPGFAQNEQDTTTIPAIQLYIKALKKQQPEIKISILTFQFPFTKQKYNWHNCDVIPLDGSNKKWKQAYVWYKAYNVLREINKKNPIHILHSFWLGECALIGNIFSKNKNIKHICTSIGQDVLKEKFYFKLFPLKKTVLICESNVQKKIFLTQNKYKPKVVSWGINTNDFIDNTNKTFDIIGVGSLIPVKNFQLFIEVIYELDKIYPVNTMIIGEGFEKELLHKKIKELQLENVITLTGLLNYKETLSNISKSKILLHTSNHEGFGMIFAEALQCKAMIVSKEVGCSFVSKNWQIGNSKNEMIAACLKSLTVSFSETEKNPFLIEKTVENYLKVYNE